VTLSPLWLFVVQKHSTIFIDSLRGRVKKNTMLAAMHRKIALNELFLPTKDE
jgi:hypothetical protein